MKQNENKTENNNSEMQEKILEINFSDVVDYVKKVQPKNEPLSLPIDTEQLTVLLSATYSARVQNGYKQMISDSQTKSNLSEVAQFLSQNKNRMGVMFLGNCGTGKTTMLKAIQMSINYLTEKCGLTTLKPLTIVSSSKIVNRDLDKPTFDKWKNAPLLAIDEFGKDREHTMAYGNTLNPIQDILDFRYENFLPTLLATNLNADELAERYGDRTFDRLCEMFKSIYFGKTSYRN